MNLGASAAGVAAARTLGLVAAVGFTVYVAHRFGSDRATDIAFNALIIPNALSVVLATLVPPVFVSAFRSVEVARGPEEAWTFGRLVPRVAAAASLAIAAAGAVLSPLLARAMGGGFPDEEVARIARYMQAAFLLVFLTSVSAALKGLLNASGSFFIPALDTAAMNLAAVGTIVLTAERWGVFSLVAGAVAGGAAKILLMAPGYVRRRRSGPTPLFHPALKQAGALLGPVLLNSAVFAVNLAVMRALAARIPMEGTVSHLNYAERVYSAPQDVFVVSMGAVMLPALAGQVAAGRMEDFRRLVSTGLRMAAFFGIPAAVGLFLLAEPVTALLYERGRFDAADTVETARALRGYAGAMAFSGLIILYQAFYAIGKTRPILVSGVVLTAVTAGLGAALVGPMRQAGLSLAYSIGYGAAFFAALALFIRAAGKLDGIALLSGVLRTGVCAAGMAAALAGLQWMTALPVLVLAAIGAGVFALLSRFLCPEEWKYARKLWSHDDQL